MKIIEIKEIEFTQDQDRFSVKSYPEKGVYLVKQDKPVGLGIIEILCIDDIVIVLPLNVIKFIIDKDINIKLKTDDIFVPQLNNQLTESFVLELVKIITK